MKTLKDLAEQIEKSLNTARAFAASKGMGVQKIVNGRVTTQFTQDEFAVLVSEYLVTPPKPGRVPRGKEKQ